MMSQIEDNYSEDGVDRRGFLKCMAWAGAGVLWTMSGGVLQSQALGMPAKAGAAPLHGDLTFVQISDSHIGFSKPANTNVTATLQDAITQINAADHPPAFVIHTGDISHMSKPDEFDTVDQLLKGGKFSKTFYVPGEHDVVDEGAKVYLERYGKGTQGGGWYSFDQKGVHFIGLNNVLNLKSDQLGQIGAEQLEWLEKDVATLKSSTPIVVFAHIPLWSVYPQWGWGTEDSARALGYLKRFGSVTVLNGHIHQALQKVEGNVTFHTARSTAFPKPEPGKALDPGPAKVPAERLRSVLGVTNVTYVRGRHSLAIIDTPLAEAE